MKTLRLGSRLLRWIGPYDYNYALIFASVVLLFTSRSRVYSDSYQSGTPRFIFSIKALAIDAVLGLSIIATLKVATSLRLSRRVSLLRYLIEILAAIFNLSLVTYLFNHFLQRQLKLPSILGVDDSPRSFFARFLFCTLFVAFSHTGLRTLSERFQAASELNRELQGRYKSLVESDEEIRDQAARYIHDRVQAEITIVTAQLNTIREGDNSSLREKLTIVISKLERIRATDLKMVSQILTPNLAAEGLKGSIESLCNQYRSGIDFEVKCSDDTASCDEEVALGIYRITEQAIINAITHGPASRVVVSISRENESQYILEITDNGTGSYNPTPGKGTVIIDAWCSILRGSKEIESIPGKGYTLRVYLPFTKRTK